MKIDNIKDIAVEESVALFWSTFPLQIDISSSNIFPISVIFLNSSGIKNYFAIEYVIITSAEKKLRYDLWYSCLFIMKVAWSNHAG